MKIKLTIEFRFFCAGWLALGLQACAGYASTVALHDSSATTVAACQSALRQSTAEPLEGLDPAHISLLNWNVKKGSVADWQDDLRSLSRGTDLVTLQEAVFNEGMEQLVDGAHHASFSQGYTTRRRVTGVATFSSARPLSTCSLGVVEPILQTRKATGITEFALRGIPQTLLVVNVHAINISLGLVRFREQMEQIEQVLSVHGGPAILSGDFNTWRPKRMAIVQQMARALDFVTVELHDDARKTFNGLPLDHVFVRGLKVSRSESPTVLSSDHNPILVELQL